jgi:hypothetical protein
MVREWSSLTAGDQSSRPYPQFWNLSLVLTHADKKDLPVYDCQLYWTPRGLLQNNARITDAAPTPIDELTLSS